MYTCITSLYIYICICIYCYLCYSLNSLAVRAPHNSSPASISVADPESVVGTGFAVKPMVFQHFESKTQ